MSGKHKLSLSAAIFININIMLGAGIFINTVELAKRAGVLGGFSYVLIGILMLPLVISIAKLITIHPEGGFYTFASKEISPLVGFISAWSFFIAKLASTILMIHTAVLLIQCIIPSLNIINTFTLDIAILSTFIGLNMMNTKIGSSIQTYFMVLKILPILFVITSGLFLINVSNFTLAHVNISGLPSALPLALYAIGGFEAMCALSSRIDNAERNAPLAIFISYATVVLLVCLYQLFFYGSLGDILTQQNNYLSAFPTFLSTLFPAYPTLQQKLQGLLHLAIAFSALGGSYGLLYSNNWNLYFLAKHRHTFFSNLLTTFNQHAIPYVCVLIEGLLGIFYLFITGGNQVWLQQIGVLGAIIAYTSSVVSLIAAKRNRPELPVNIWIPTFGMANCLFLIGTCIRNFMISGIHSLIAFIILFIFGIWMFKSTQEQRST